MDARTVNFDDYNSKDDLGVTFISLTLGAPEPKLLEVEIPYADGVLDFTESFSEVRYNNRETEMEFHIPVGSDHMAVYSNFLGKVNGQRMKITFSADQDYYYYGRCVVDGLECDDGRWGFAVTATVEPYKYKQTLTEYSGTGDGTVTMVNDRKTVMVYVDSTATANITIGSTQYSVSAGASGVALCTIGEGSTAAMIETEGTYKLYYREGRL